MKTEEINDFAEQTKKTITNSRSDKNVLTMEPGVFLLSVLFAMVVGALTSVIVIRIVSIISGR